MYKSIKNSPIASLFVKLIFTSVVLYIFYTQINKLSWVEIKKINIQNPIPFVTAILLSFVNQYLEYSKWKNTLKFIQESKHKIQSYLAGALTGFLTPSLLGNFIGRMYYYPRVKRPQIITLTMLSNGAQFIASIYFGLISLAWLGQKQLNIPTFEFYIVSIGITIILLLYYFFDNFYIPIPKWKTKILPLLSNTKEFRVKLLTLSIIRYIIFSTQYFLLFLGFGIPFSFELLGWIWQIYFWSTLSPSLLMGKLFIRESIALWVLVPIIGHPEIILSTSIALWILNHGIIALIALPFFKKQIAC